MRDQEPQPGGRIRAMSMLIDKGAGRYDGSRHLDRLLGGGFEIWNDSDGDPAARIVRLKRALRSERRLGQAGHWSYDLNRHFGLLQALKAELARSRAHTAATASEGPPMASGISDTGTQTS